MLIRRSRTLVADDHQVAAVDGGWVTSLRIRPSNAHHERLVLRLHDRASTPAGDVPIDDTATPFLPILTLLALTQGLRLQVDAAVDDVAFDGARQAAAQLATWWDTPDRGLSARRRSTARVPSNGTALFFSRGLDSMHSLFCGPHTVDQLIGIDWEDPPLASDGTRAIMRGTVGAYEREAIRPHVFGRFGDLDIAQHCVRRGDTAGGGVRKHHDVGQSRIMQHLNSDR